MRRYEDIQELLGVVDRNIMALEGAYEAAKHNEDHLVVARPVIKTVLGDLRGVLDYCAVSIYESYSRKNGFPHFPYGKDKASFLNSVKKHLNGLAEQSPKVFSLIESIQPHSCGDTWLLDLCTMTNITKHRHLGVQNRLNSTSGSVNIGGRIVISGGSSASLSDIFYGDTEVIGSEPVLIADSMSGREVREILGNVVDISKSYDWVSFEMQGHPYDLLGFLKKSSSNVRAFSDALAEIIEL
jgi:predicted heme/steroid binding protein